MKTLEEITNTTKIHIMLASNKVLVGFGLVMATMILSCDKSPTPEPTPPVIIVPPKPVAVTDTFKVEGVANMSVIAATIIGGQRNGEKVYLINELTTKINGRTMGFGGNGADFNLKPYTKFIHLIF